MTNIGFTIAGIFCALILIIFCTHFSARLAQLKGRSRAWGFLGFLLSIIGLVIVCFLPSKRTDSINTNPITHLTSKIPNLSKKTIYIVAGIVFAVILTVIAYDNIPNMIENYKYSKQVTKQNQSEYEQPDTIFGEVEKIFATSESSFVITKDKNAYCLGKQFAPHIEGQATGVFYKNAVKVLSGGNKCYVLNDTNQLYVAELTENKEENEQETVEENQQETEETEIFKLISENVIDFSISETTLAIIKTDKKLYMYGNNAYGQLGVGNKEPVENPVAILDNVAQVHCEATFTVALNSKGEVYAFGSNSHNQFGKEETEFLSPTLIQNNIKQITAGDDCIILLDNNKQIRVCGNNDCGQLGNGTNEKLAQFTVILSDIEKIHAEKKSVFALSSSKELYGWGYNSIGQLGTNNLENSNLPIVVATDVADFSTSGLHTLILKDSTNLYGTGYNNCNQLGNAKALKQFDKLIAVR